MLNFNGSSFLQIYITRCFIICVIPTFNRNSICKQRINDYRIIIIKKYVISFFSVVALLSKMSLYLTCSFNS